MSRPRAIPQLFELLRQHALSERAQSRLRARHDDHLSPEMEQDFLSRADQSWRPIPT